ncbi:MAG: ABC transporter ATP-binding protein [Candidatus Heimdallarchaeaceae archaeon]
MVHVKLVNISKYYGKTKAVNNINLEIQDKEYVAILGPTGAGKTSTMYMLAGLLQPTEGRIYFDGKDVTNLPAEDREIGFVFEEYNLFPRMTVEENILFGPRVKSLDIAESKNVAKELLHLLNISGKEKAYPNEISGGQKQRVALARAIVSNAKLLIMDDPLRALDAKIREVLQVELRSLVKDLGLTCIHATHDIHEAMRVADKIAIFQHGQIVQFGTPEEIYNHPKTLEIAQFLSKCSTLEGIIVEEGKEKFAKISKNIKLKIQTDLEEGTKVIVLIPAELVDIYTKKEKEIINYDNIVNCEIVDIKCIGEFYQYRIKLLDSDIEIIGNELIGRKHILKKGEMAVFASDKDDFRVFKKVD